MKYTYAYKTSDGTRHEASINAESREAVFSQLRKQGIKAIKVVAADGSKANGEIRGVRKRVVLLAVVIAVLVTGSIYFILPQQHTKAVNKLERQFVAMPIPRQQISGDRSRIENATKCFESKAEAFLAQFVEPGRPFSASENDWPTISEFNTILNKPLKYSENELTEFIDVKRMVEYLKDELKKYLSGGGELKEYLSALVNRQQTEINVRAKYAKLINDILTAPIQCMAGEAVNKRRQILQNAYENWLKANAQLQAMGIYPLPCPPVLEHLQLLRDLSE